MIIDTDVIIRYLTNDDPKKAERFARFLQLEGKGMLTDVTFAEVYWTCTSFYKIHKEKVLSMLEALINEPVISSNIQILSRTIDILRRHTISFVDAYTSATALNSDKIILSFDHDFDKIVGIKRVEP